MTAGMRLFYAAEIPDETLKALAEIQKKLKKSNAYVKWVEPYNLHITLCFLGEVKPNLIPRLTEIGSEAGKLYGSFNVSLKNFGVFPEKGIPRVLWAGIEEGKSPLLMLAEALRSRVETLDVERKEQSFKAHVTLGRIKGPKGIKELSGILGTMEFASGEWRLKTFVLKESFLSKSGPTYKSLYSFPLGA